MNGDGPIPTIIDQLRAAAERIACVSDTAQLDAEILMAHALGITRGKLLARLTDRIAPAGYPELVARRVAWEPLAYILGHWEFFSLDFLVTPPLLVPRPETEHLVEAVLDHIGAGFAQVLEIGTGTGCVGIAIAANAPNARIVATDINQRALATAAENAARLGIHRIAFRCGALFEPVQEMKFDVVCSNPPYVEDGAWPGLSPVIRLHEDPRALLAGPDGLDVIRPLIEQAARHLNPGGLLAFEMGMGQDQKVAALLETAGYRNVGFRKDLAGINRIAVATMNG